MSKEDLEQNLVSSKQEVKNLDFWDTYCNFSDSSDPERDSIKPKCNKYLKKKLKKYRKRRNGEEDPEVLEVSLTLNESLSFPISDYHNNNNEVDIDDFGRPQNYLMKMVRNNKNSQKTVKAVIKNNNKNCDKPQDDVKPVFDKKQESKQKNAFQLMMDSRNKSIGSNSPGKEKNDNDDFEEDMVLEKKATKAKRNLLLQKMAEAKGALKNKEVEEIQDEIITKKMQKRAKRLKEMITKESKNAKKNNEKIKKRVDISDKPAAVAKSNKSKLRSRIIDVDVQVCPEPVIISPPTKKISKEDEEFLNKLSPSLKKKENMLCYFKKIEKETETQPEDTNSENNEVEGSCIIKVKLAPRSKKSLKKRKLSLKTILVQEDSKDCNENNFNSPNIVTTTLESPKVNDVELAAAETGSRKRKRKTKLDNNEHSEEIVLDIEPTEGRPRRHVKKPVKYAEDVNISSSDDELLIITPKKKKHIDKEFVKGPSRDKERSSGNLNKKLRNKENAKKATKLEPKGKLAPIFMPKPQIDPAALEAKQKFLQSGVPEQLKKIAAQQTVQINNSICFHSVVHIRQDSGVLSKEVKFDFYKSSNDSSKSDDSRADDNACGEKFFENLLYLRTSLLEATHALTPNTKYTKEILQSIKYMYPEFPVYRTYRTLRNKSKGDHTDINFVEFDNSNEALEATLETTAEDPKSLCWVDKYKATSTKQIIGNFESMKELRKWLSSWKESQVCSKNSQGNDSDSDFYHSDTDSRDNAAMANNLVIVTGPAGSGKTSGVHAAAAELAFKVIEVNVGSRRTGKILLQDLQEATQSHKVNRAKGGSADNSQNILDCLSKSQSKKQKKTKQNSKSNSQRSENSQPLLSQDDGRTGMSLILIDDADVVFEQDDGFISGILQLVQCSKRPVVIVASSLTSQNMQRFLNCENIIKLRPLLPRMLGTWLDLVCLAELGAGWPGAGAALLDYCRGDIRKATNCLNFYAFSEVHKQNNAIEDADSDDEEKIINCDETSNMSWAGGDSEEIKCSVKSEDTLFTRDIVANFKDSSDLGDKWWSLHDVLGIRNSSIKNLKKLQDITTAVDALSIGDLLSQRSPKNIICPSPWYNLETDSVSERDSLESVNNFYDACSEISMHLVETTLATNSDSNASQEENKETTSYMLQRDRDKTVSRHKLLAESLVPCSVLDRKAIALDYWPAFRAICRAEKVKTDCNLKRNNRFTHYLKTTKIGAKSDVFTKLGDVLNA